MGKPLRDGVAEAQKCAFACDFYADNAARFLAREPVATEARASFVTFNPIGVVLAVMPWNFPFWQVFRFAAPGLMAGNAAVLKHASNVPGCALAIEALFREAGFPEHLFRTLMISTRQVEAVIESPLVRAVTLTGSGPAVRAVASKAGAMLKKTVLLLIGRHSLVNVGQHGRRARAPAVSSSSGSPILTAPMRSTNRSSNARRTLSTTMKRLPAMQLWPEFTSGALVLTAGLRRALYPLAWCSAAAARGADNRRMELPPGPRPRGSLLDRRAVAHSGWGCRIKRWLQTGERVHLARQLYGLRSRLPRPRDMETGTPRKLFGPKVPMSPV
jgi:hypothetical protein